MTPGLVRIVALLAALSVTQTAAAAGPRQDMSPAPWAEPVQTQCMSCAEKCDKCAKAGTSPTYTIDSCKKDCTAAGNPQVNATCGVRQRC